MSPADTDRIWPVTFVHGGWWLAVRSSDDRCDHVVIVFQVDKRRGIPTRRDIRNRPLSGYRSRYRNRRREQRQVGRRNYPRHRVNGRIREDLLQEQK